MATRTRTRSQASPKADEQKAEKDAAAAKAAEKEQDKAKKAEEAKAKKEQAEKERAEKKAAKEAERAAERQKLIDAGELIEHSENGNVTEYTVSEPKKDLVAQRAAQVIEELKADGREVPISGKYFADKYGGGTVQWVAFFGMLRVLGLVTPYRFKTGNRGESGLSYRWIGD
jgi:septal ring factor EnvC (AmiA/AmiB activator)